MTPYILLIVPVVLAVVALARDWLPAKMGVPLSAAAIIVVAGVEISSSGLILAALFVSAVGDYFLSNKGAKDGYFVYGIAAYFVAHLGYGGFALASGGFSIPVLAAGLAVFLPYYVLAIRPVIEDTILSVSVCIYLIVSCLVLSAAVGRDASGAAKSLFVAAIALIVLSAFAISLKEFLRFHRLDWLILPTYYAAHLCIIVAVVSR